MFIRWLKYISKKLKRLFTKRPPSAEKIVNEEKIILEGALPTELIYAQIEETTDDTEKEKLIKQVVRQEVAIEIISYAESEIAVSDKKNKGKRRLYELHELRDELQKLKEQKAFLRIRQKEIRRVSYTDSSIFGKMILGLNSLLTKNKKNDKIELSNISISNFDSDFKKLEKLLTSSSAYKKHENRELQKRKAQKNLERKIISELNDLDSLISRSKLDEAKDLIEKLSKFIKHDFVKGRERISKAKIRIKIKEEEVFKRRQAEIIRQQQEAAERLKQIEWQRQEDAIYQKRKLFETETEYAIQLQAQKDSFSCASILSCRRQFDLYDNLGRGTALLSGDKELRQYIYSFGKMHIEKLRSAFQLLINSNNFDSTVKSIEIFDWGCGQGLGSIALIDQLRIFKSKVDLVKSITLIEPGRDALRRAALHSFLAIKNERIINPVNKYIGTELIASDLANSKNSAKYHIFSNIIDVPEVDADYVAELITSSMVGVNYIICVGPRFGDSRDRKMEYFSQSFKYCNGYELISDREDGQGWRHDETWTRKEIIVKVNL
jgi:hypothetical protein